QGGTLFLDEIGDMPLELQAVLLRVLEDKEVMRIGGRRYKKVDFRLIAATNKPLDEMAKENLFREDLYFRLSVLSIQLPPLRNREHDAELLSGYFIRKYCKKVGSKLRTLSPEAQKIIMAYNWPGNIRQLESAMSFALNMTQSDVIEPKDLPEYLTSTKNLVKINFIANDEEKTEEILSLRKLEKAAIDLALIHAHNSIPRAAALLGISKATLYRKLKEYNYDQL
ncbi:MAG TPA: sigma 54-interacting transcriptional regulator, partial [Desulfitobacterium dehalogenans]|nr:sigma 54-interacting transcriptional regulator [Desulfitobacterium dehalogenans]